MKNKIFVTRRLPDKPMKLLENHFEVRVNKLDRVLTRQEIIAGAEWCDILLCLLTDEIDADVIAANPNLKGISNYAVGYNNIDLEYATKKRIPVCNTPGVLTETTADLTWALILGISRRLVESDKFNRAGKFKGWSPTFLLGTDVFGKTLGIIGAGRIGTAVVKRAVGFNMKIIYADRSKNEFLENELKAVKKEFNDLLTQSDFVSIHVPFTKETYHLISETELKIMKDQAFLINTSRGPVIDEKMLVKALKQKWIAGAGLDVYENEPEMTEGLTNLPNVILTPHTGSATVETRTKMGMLAAENAIDLIEKRLPKEIVNPEVLI